MERVAWYTVTKFYRRGHPTVREYETEQAAKSAMLSFAGDPDATMVQLHVGSPGIDLRPEHQAVPSVSPVSSGEAD